MAILSKGQTFVNGDTVTSTKLNNLVDLATLASGCVDGVSTTLVGGQIIVRDGGLLPAKLSTGAPTWTSEGDLTIQGVVAGNVTVQGTFTSGGKISTSNDIQASAGLTSNTYLQVDGISTLTGNATFLGSIVAHGTSTGKTVPLKTASATPNAISFGWDGTNNYLLVKIDENNYRVTLTAV
jgi:hypothetical protein